MRETRAGTCVRIFITLSLLFCGGKSSFAAETMNGSRPALDRPVKVAFTHFPPWSYKTASGQYTGIIVEYIRDLAQDIKMELKEEDIPISRLHHSSKQGKLDLFFSLLPENSLPCCTSLGKVYDSETVILRKKTGPLWTPPGNSAIAVCRTGLSTYEVPGYRMFDADSLGTCVRMVARDRIPFLIGERYSLYQILQTQALDVSSLFDEAIVVDKKPFYLFTSKALDQSTFGPNLRKAVLERRFADYINRYKEAGK